MRSATQRGRLFIQVTGPGLRLARIMDATGAPRVERLLDTCCSNSRDANALTDAGIQEQLARCVADCRLADQYVTLIVGGLTAGCHHLRLPMLDKRQLHGAARLKLANLLPFDTAEALVDFAVFAPPAGAHATPVRAVTIHAPVAQAMCDAVRNAGLAPIGIVPTSCALEPLVPALMGEPAGQASALLFIDEFSACGLLTHDGAVAHAGDPPLALNDLTTALTRPIIDGERSITLTAAQAQDLRDDMGIPPRGAQVPLLGVAAERILPLLEPVLQQWTRSIMQWLTYAAGGNETLRAHELVLAGPASRVTGLAATLSERLQLPVRTATGIVDDEPRSASMVVSTAVVAAATITTKPQSAVAPQDEAPAPHMGAAPGEHFRMERREAIDPYELHEDAPAATELMGAGTATPLPSERDAKSAGAATGLTRVRTSATLTGMLPMIGVARGGATVPRLVPSALRRERQIERVSRMACICGPALAAGFVLLTVVFWRAGGGLSSSLAAESVALERVKSQVERQREIALGVEQVRHMQRELRTFADGSPRWLGLFKELSSILPETVFLRQLEATGPPHDIELRISAYVQSPDATTPFDQLIHRSLLALQESPFFEDVQVVSANRNSGREDWGELEVHVRLVYPGRRDRKLDGDTPVDGVPPPPARSPLEPPHG